MRTLGLLLAFVSGLVAQIPTVNDYGVVRADTAQPGILGPGVAFSIWGHNYGSHDVQVLLDGVPIVVQYASDVQINALMPAATSVPEVSHLIVVSGGRRSVPVEVRRLPETAKISLDGVARIGGPIWIHVELPRFQRVSYPSMAMPWNFGCDGFEVRKDGKIIAPAAPKASLPMMYSGPMCPGDANPGDRLPLHLQYELKEPGTYEVRLSHYGDFGRRQDDVRIQSAWTPIEILPAVAPKVLKSHPQEPGELVRDFLPSLLARRDDEALGLFLEYLYHASPRVRGYAAYALYYWPDDVVEKRLLETLRANGPSPVVMQRLHARAAEVAELSVPYFFSEDPLLFQGAIEAARAALAPVSGVNPEMRTRVEERVMAATGNIRRADAQTANDLVALLGQIHTDRAHELLWDFADRHMHEEQALICITWQKNPKDLPRLTEYLIAEPEDDKSGALSSVAYGMHNAFGDASLPWLRTIVEKSGIMFLRTSAASELMRANDAAGFAFAADAIENNRAWKREIRSRVIDQFPDIRNDTDVQMAAFLRTRM